jgi:cardiolipin synthase
MMDKSNYLNLSNSLSFLRIFLAIPIYIYLAAGENGFALVFIMVAVITDFLDGYFARRNNQITDVGKILDPLADKVCTISGFVALYQFQNFPVWLAWLIIGRDLMILTASFYFIRKTKIVLSSNRVGKITVFLIALYAIVYILKLYTIAIYLYYIVIIFIFLSLLNYSKVFLTELKSDRG